MMPASIDEMIKRISSEKDPIQIAAVLAASLLTDPERELLRRCAVTRLFDRCVLNLVLRKHPPEVREKDVGFERVRDLPPVERVARAQETYRVRQPDRNDLLGRWNDTEDLNRLSQVLVDYYRTKEYRNEFEELYHQTLVDPESALARFRVLFSGAAAAYDLVRCDELLDALTNPQALFLWPDIAAARENHATVLAAHSLFAEDFVRTAQFLERPVLTSAIESLLARDGPQILQLYARGGSGKTTFLRWVIARRCVPNRIPCARIDFDDPGTLELLDDPRRLVLELAVQFNRQITGSPFLELINELSRSTNADAASVLRRFTDVLTSALPRNTPSLLILDTLEDPLISRRAALINVLSSVTSILSPLATLTPNLQSIAARGAKLEDPAPLRVILSGRLDLRDYIAGGDFSLSAPLATNVEIPKFSNQEATAYLRILGVTGPEVLTVVLRSDGNPLMLWLYAEILRAEPEPAWEQILAESQVDLVYLIRRIVLRIPELGTRLVLRYGAIPERLTREYVTEVIAPHWSTLLAADDKERGLDNALKMQRPFLAAQGHVTPEGLEQTRPPNLEALWERLKEFAGQTTWVQVASLVDEPEALVFRADVLNPMRRLLEQEPIVLLVLHCASIAYFYRKADADPDRWERWARQAVYHDFQLRGAAAGIAWRSLMENPRLRDRPDRRIELANEVVGTSYLDDDPKTVKPRLRADGSPMIAESDLALAFFHLASDHVRLARSDVSAEETARHWKEAGDALVKLDQLQNGAAGRVIPDTRVAAVRAAVLAHEKKFSAALDAIRKAGEAADPTERLVLLLAEADVLAELRRRNASDVYERWLALAEQIPHAIPAGVTVAAVREKLAVSLCYFDRWEDAAPASMAALAEATNGPDQDAVARRERIYRRILLAIGRPWAALHALEILPRVFGKGRNGAPGSIEDHDQSGPDQALPMGGFPPGHSHGSHFPLPHGPRAVLMRAHNSRQLPRTKAFSRPSPCSLWPIRSRHSRAFRTRARRVVRDPSRPRVALERGSTLSRQRERNLRAAYTPTYSTSRKHVPNWTVSCPPGRSSRSQTTPPASPDESSGCCWTNCMTSARP